MQLRHANSHWTFVAHFVVWAGARQKCQQRMMGICYAEKAHVLRLLAAVTKAGCHFCPWLENVNLLLVRNVQFAVSMQVRSDNVEQAHAPRGIVPQIPFVKGWRLEQGRKEEHHFQTPKVPPSQSPQLMRDVGSCVYIADNLHPLKAISQCMLHGRRMGKLKQ